MNARMWVCVCLWGGVTKRERKCGCFVKRGMDVGCSIVWMCARSSRFWVHDVFVLFFCRFSVFQFHMGPFNCSFISCSSNSNNNNAEILTYQYNKQHIYIQKILLCGSILVGRSNASHPRHVVVAYFHNEMEIFITVTVMVSRSGCRWVYSVGQPVGCSFGDIYGICDVVGSDLISHCLTA